MTCLTTTQYSILINGVPSDLIQPKRGLRQEDPLSLQLFTLCMEYFSRTMLAVGDHPSFKFHYRCRTMQNHTMESIATTTELEFGAQDTSLLLEEFNYNFVLMRICVYWSQIFILPKVVLKIINAICRAFLWFGTYEDGSPGSMAWDRLCLPKQQGGLGFRNLLPWNQAAVGKLAWSIAQKQDNLGLNGYTCTVYVKDKYWDSYVMSNLIDIRTNHIC
ncbi:uncharacterized protein [Spinacia oleracea]|uniref:Reverse transcriptase domain-containing protein n=1 Tax=Spinacia oleracea TaxID=3562 RepID=A0ABM3RJA7_SPIOL|nr:uncharacterized protein LOC130470110 [Spinacia oleracea]